MSKFDVHCKCEGHDISKVVVKKIRCLHYVENIICKIMIASRKTMYYYLFLLRPDSLFRAQILEEVLVAGELSVDLLPFAWPLARPNPNRPRYPLLEADAAHHQRASFQTALLGFGRGPCGGPFFGCIRRFKTDFCEEVSRPSI